MTMTTDEIRSAFLQYFQSKQHQTVTSSSLVPGNDPTLLFTNAGMVQFKDTFLGSEQRSYNRAVSSQRCVRAGGKHNDLENVGYTARHHTFFEMLGNFSFGDYFKRDAIQFAWEFLTQELKLPKEKLWVTVFDEDEEAADIWLNEIGISPDSFSRIGAKDNFWSMGDTGPCGPCTEIFYDHGPDVAGGPPGTPEEDGDRYIEIWNLVFMQFNRHSDGTMEPLPKPSVDTGMGLERLAAILQNGHSNYDIDIFQALIASAAKIVGTKDLSQKSLRVISDHIRSCSFMIADGVMPSNEGRGYVLRRIIRRAVRHGNKLGATGTFFYKLLPELITQMGQAYPELKAQQALIKKMLKLEEQQFGKTLERGMLILEDELEQLKANVIPGDLVFKLYDTYGFPADLTADIARERNLTIDQDGFELAMQAQRKRAQQAGSFDTDYNKQITVEGCTEFVGYKQLSNSSSLKHIFKNGVAVDKLAATECDAGDKITLVLEKSAFYAESGGQVGDSGLITFSQQDGASSSYRVTNTQKSGSVFLHQGSLSQGSIKIGDLAKTQVDADLRIDIARNHSATHLLHSALREVLGDHVQQKGSMVSAARLRFDFSHFESISSDTIRQIESLVNEKIRENTIVDTQLMDLEQAKESGAMALFGEKYDEKVRVVNMGAFSTELCGGTHVQSLGEIGFFKIISESGIAAGVRRIEADTGASAIDFIHSIGKKLESVSYLIKGDQFSVVDSVKQIVERTKQLEKENAQLKNKLAKAAGDELIDKVVTIAGVNVLVQLLDNADPKALRGMVDDLKVKMGSGIICLGTASADKVSLIAGVTKDLIKKVKAGDLVNMVAGQVGGKGGGRPDMAQAGGTEPENLPLALRSVTAWLEERL